MLIKPVYNAFSRPDRSLFDVASLAIALVLSLLFAATIVGALSPHPMIDPMIASVQGGL